MSGAFDRVPGLRAYLAAQDMQEQRQMSELQQAAALQSLAAGMRKQQQEQAYRSAVQGLGPNPSLEQLAQVSAPYAGPDTMMRYGQAALDRKAALEQRATEAASKDALQRELASNREGLQRELGLARLEQQQRHDQLVHEFNLAKAQTDAERLAETKRHNMQAEQTAAALAELRGQIETNKQGQQAEADARRKQAAIEQSINKTQSHIKDLGPAYSAAQQVNEALSQYTPETVPGVGYAKNTDVGKAFLSDEGKLVASKIKLFGNAVLKAMSGTAVTAPEEVRQMAAQMADGRYSAADFYRAWPTMAKWMNDQMALGTASLSPDAREEFVKRSGLDLSPIKPRFGVEGGKLVDTRGTAAPTGWTPEKEQRYQELLKRRGGGS